MVRVYHNLVGEEKNDKDEVIPFFPGYDISRETFLDAIAGSAEAGILEQVSLAMGGLLLRESVCHGYLAAL